MSESIEPKSLFGTWRLLSAHASDAEGRALADPYGPAPMGRLVLAADGRMMAVLCDGRTAIPDGETRAYSSYCGNYRIEGEFLITIVDAAAVTGRLGSAQRRKLELRGGNLVLRPPARDSGEQRELVWERISPL